MFPAELDRQELLVSVPFSMGTVLLLLQVTITPPSPMFQSPSRWGRCCFAGIHRRHDLGIILFQSPSRWGRCCFQHLRWRRAAAVRMFQSPSRWGRCCFCPARNNRPLPRRVSVPFSMGTVLLPPAPSPAQLQARPFQSPSRWGRCCFRVARERCPTLVSSFSPLLDGDGVASGSFRDGEPQQFLRFSPLLDGDGVASIFTQP